MAATVAHQHPLAALLDVWECFGTGDPTTGAGLPAGIGSHYTDSASGAFYVKTGAGDTAWTLATGGGGGTSLPTPTDGDLLYGLGGAWVVLPIGVAGQVLHVNAGLPAWGTVTPPVTFLSLLRSTDGSPLLSTDASPLVPATP